MIMMMMMMMMMMMVMTTALAVVRMFNAVSRTILYEFAYKVLNIKHFT